MQVPFLSSLSTRMVPPSWETKSLTSIKPRPEPISLFVPDTGGDSVSITRMIPKPADFLQTDTLICEGYPSKIQAVAQFNSYNWSTGEKNNYIILKKAGTYSLTVTDQNEC